MMPSLVGGPAATGAAYSPPYAEGHARLGTDALVCGSGRPVRSGRAHAPWADRLVALLPACARFMESNLCRPPRLRRPDRASAHRDADAPGLGRRRRHRPPSDAGPARLLDP